MSVETKTSDSVRLQALEDDINQLKAQLDLLPILQEKIARLQRNHTTLQGVVLSMSLTQHGQQDSSNLDRDKQVSELEKLKNRLRDVGYDVKISSKAINFLCEKGFDQKYGARPLKRAIQNYVEDLIAEEIVKSNLREGTKIKIDCSKDDSKLKIIKL